MTSQVAGFAEPVTPKKQGKAHTVDKPDAALRAATLSFTPPFTRQPSAELSSSPSKANGNTALIAARIIGTGTPSPRPLASNSPDHGFLSRTTSSDAASIPGSPVHAGSLKAAQLSVGRNPSISSTSSASRSRSIGNEGNPLRSGRSQSDDVTSSNGGDATTHGIGPLIAAKTSAIKKISHIGLGPSDSPPSLLAAGLAVSRSATATPGNTAASMAQPERDQEPDILPPSGSVSDAKRRLLQQTDGGESISDSPVRGRRSIDMPLRPKHSKTFSDTPPLSTAQISPLSAAKLAVQHSGRTAGASSAGPPAVFSKPRQPSPIKKEIKRDITPINSQMQAPKPNFANKPTLPKPQVVQVIKPLPPKSGPKPIPRKIAPQDTGASTGSNAPPPQPIKPLPRKARGPARASRAVVPDTAGSSSGGEAQISKPAPARALTISAAQSSRAGTTPILPPPRGTNITNVVPSSEPVKQGPPPVKPKRVETTSLEPVKRIDADKPEPPPVKPKKVDTMKPEAPPLKPKPVEVTKPTIVPKPQPSELETRGALAGSSESTPLTHQSRLPVISQSAGPAKQQVLPPKEQQELPIVQPKPEQPITKSFVESIVARQPPSLYQQQKEQTASAATLPVLPPPRGHWNRRSSSSLKSVQMLRKNHTGPDSTKSSARPSPSWRDDLPYNFSPQPDDYLKPSHTGDSLRHAIVASSLASSRAGSPIKNNPIPLPPRPSQGFRTTMRSPEKQQERDPSPHKKNHLLGKKHPNKHNEGARKRWREFVTEKERKRYEGLWAANRGLYLNEKMFEGRPDTQHKNLHLDAVCSVVVRELWSRSRLPLDILEQVWDLVDRGPRPKWWLTRDEFIMGLWLIDQSLKGRKLPGKVQGGTWESVRRMGVVLKGYDELGFKDAKKMKKR